MAIIHHGLIGKVWDSGRRITFHPILIPIFPTDFNDLPLFFLIPMLLTPSPEFISLCRSQVILAQGLGASFSIVYLAKDLV
ncbi:MAG: hypothetical protein EBV05_03295, partial [Cyanobacteria bacterium WB6_1B_304]|nr:hypothetical protein [Cyanobacteria bacterium WB6_1B_304]